MAINAGTILAYLDLDTSKFGNALQLAQQQMGDFADNGGGVSGMLDGVGAAATTVGHVLTVGVSTPILGAGVAIAKWAGDFQASANVVETIADTTAMSMDALNKGVLNISNDTGLAATDINAALYQTISATNDTANALAYTEIAAKAAKGGFTDTATAIDGLTTVMNAYGLQGEDAMMRVSDQMLTAQNYGKTTFGELASSIGKVIPLAAQLNVGTDELFASIATLTKQGIGTAEAVTGLKAALSNVIKPTSEASKMAETLGLDFSAAALESKGFAGFLADVREKTGGNTEVMAQLFGSVEALNTIMALTSDTGMVDMAGGLDAMASSAGATDNAYQTMMGGLNTGIARLTNSFRNYGIAMGTILLPYIEKAVGWLQRGVDWLSGLNEGVQKFILGGAGIAAALGPALTVGGKLLSVFSPVIPMLAAVGGAFALIYGRSERLQAITAKLRTNGVAAFTGLRNGVQSYLTQVESGVSRTDALTQAVRVAFGEDAGGRINALIARLTDGFATAGGVLRGTANGVGEFIASLIDGQGAAVSLEEGLQAAFGGNVPERVRTLQAGVSQLITDIRNDFAAGGVIAVARGLGGRIAEALREGWDALTEGAQGLRDTLTNGLALTREWIAPKAREWMQNIGTTLRSGGVQRGLGKLTAVGGAIMERITEGKSLLTDKAGELLTWLGDALSGDEAQQKLGDLTSVAAGIAGKIASGIGSWRVTAGKLIGGLVTQLTDSGFLGTALEGIGDIVISIAEGLAAAAGNMATAAEKIITQLVTSITKSGLIEATFTQAGTLITKIAGIIGAAAPGIITAAAAIATALLSGLTGLDWPTIFTTASTVITSIAGVLSGVAGDIVTAAASLGKELLSGLAELDWATLFTAAGTIVMDLGTTLASNASQIAGAALDLGKALLTGLAAVDWAGVSSSLATACGELVAAIVDWFSQPENLVALKKAGIAILDGIFTGLSGGRLGVSEIATQLVSDAFDRSALDVSTVQDNGRYIAETWTDGWLFSLEQGISNGSLSTNQQIAMAVALMGQGFGDEVRALDPDIYTAAEGIFNSAYRAINNGNLIANFSMLGYQITDEFALAISNNQINVEDAMRALSLGMDQAMILSMSQSDLRNYLNTYFTDTSTEIQSLLSNAATDWGKIFGKAIPDGATVGLENGMLTLRSKTGEVIDLVSAVDAQTTVATGNKDTAQAGIDAAAKTLGEGETAVGEAAQGVVDAAVTPFADLPPEAQVQAAVMMEGINAAITAGTPAATTAIDTAANAVTGRAAEILNNGAGSSIGQDFAGGIAGGILSKQSGLRIAARGVATGSVSAASAAMSSGDGYSIGQNMVQGIIDGVGSMASALASRMRRLAAGAVSAFRGALDMHSPSVLLMADGALMAQSIGLGVTRGTEEAIRSMVTLAGEMQRAWPGVDVDSANVTDNPHSRGAGDTDGGGYVFQFFGDITVREEADIQKVSAALAEEMRDMLRGRGY